MIEKENFPRISIITPSLEQGDFIEETVNSVLGQDYPALEFIVRDGGSTDKTIEILKKNENRLGWISEPDGGQTEAINKGLAQATGDIVAFLNSDDLYLPGTLQKVAETFGHNPEIVCLAGRCRMINESGQPIRDLVTKYKNFWMRIGCKQVLFILNYISQPAVFWRRSIMDEIGFLDEHLDYAMDYEYWLRISERYQISMIHEDLAAFRVHTSSKSTTSFVHQFAEELGVAKRYASGGVVYLHRLHNALIIFVYRLLAFLGRLSA